MILSGTADSAQAAGGLSGVILVVYLVAIIAFFYFVMIRPQKKEQAKINAMLSKLETGDSILTTSGFYGIIIDIDDSDDTVIVEFGNNKNCRIPMNKTAIAQVEKANRE
ncbi:MAG: preprotein translocase subunit YajC [Lachnospiraceae bacterium]|nr:preprotein translocase subunit YajC [Lachnospiraceae bacterium]